MESDEKPKGSNPVKGNEKNTTKSKPSNIRWVIKIFIITFIISVILSFISESITESINIISAVIVLILFILLGIIFDIIGVSVTSADDKALNSMAARKVRGARTALWCISKAPLVSNFCNGVIGDISSILSGSMGAVISAEVAKISGLGNFFSTIIVTGLISSFTVGGKALGKSFAIKNSSNIVFFSAKVMCLVIPERFFTKK
jgi:hypothetical protein